MATSRIAATEGSGKNIATHSFSEDAVTKELQRVVVSTSAGVEAGTSGSPLKVDISAITAAVTSPVGVVGTIAHDAADSGNPVKIGAKASATLSDDTMVANADRTDAVSDLDSALIVRSQFPLGDLISERVSNTDGSSTAFTNFGATASTRNYVTAISIANTSSSNGYVDFRDGTAGSVLFTIPIPANGGAVMTSNVPLFRTTANTALAFDVSGALTTVYISISGFKSKV